MAMRDDLHALIDSLSEDETAQALTLLRDLAHAHPATTDRLSARMGPATVSGQDFMTTAPASLAALTAVHGVRPIARAEALMTDIWPEDPAEDPDLFRQTLKEWRRDDGHA